MLHRQGGRPNSLHQLKFFVAALRCCAIFVFILPLFFTGCGVHQPSLNKGTGSYRTLPDKYQKKALNYEAKGQLREAIQSWWIVLSFHPDDVEIKEKISALNQEAIAKADGHFKKGVNYYQKGQLRDARREFLLVLAYDQDHGLALDYLQTKLQRPLFRTYAVQAGDTVRDIAVKEYSDPQKFFLITAFNDVDSSKELVAATLLQLPLLGTNFLGKKDSAQNMPKRQRREHHEAGAEHGGDIEDRPFRESNVVHCPTGQRQDQERRGGEARNVGGHSWKNRNATGAGCLRN